LNLFILDIFTLSYFTRGNFDPECKVSNHKEKNTMQKDYEKYLRQGLAPGKTKMNFKEYSDALEISKDLQERSDRHDLELKKRKKEIKSVRFQSTDGTRINFECGCPFCGQIVGLIIPQDEFPKITNTCSHFISVFFNKGIRPAGFLPDPKLEF
jgi:hypothetical protein